MSATHRPKEARTRITVTRNGPYLVEGSVPLARQVIHHNERGESWEWRQGETFDVGETYRLCRCGGSSTKPFCDDADLTNGFDGTETAKHVPYLEQASVQVGPDLVLTDAPRLCAFARFCDARGGIWDRVDQGGEAARAQAERQASHCPSGRLVTWDGQPSEGAARTAEPTFDPPSIGVVQDPRAGVSGPLWVRGGIPIVSADGTPYEVRNRVTLCRCGASRNKPFCDGSHARVRFRDQLLDEASVQL